MESNNIILIGMPGAGKSTVGAILAEKIAFEFIDTDEIIQARERYRLQEIIDKDGLDYFRYAEEQMLLNLNLEHCVIATGGSVIYYPTGIKEIARSGILVYLKVSLPELQQRIKNMGERGIVIAPGQTFAQLYQERTSLYEQYARLTIDCDNKTAQQVAERLAEKLKTGYPELIED